MVVTMQGGCIRVSPSASWGRALIAPDLTIAPSELFKELGELRYIRNFHRVILMISSAFFIYTFGWGVTSPVFSTSTFRRYVEVSFHLNFAI
ncbi:MAG TPA: hypothetical protein VND40_01885 [Nitrososphaerales archaeon]|nr:hypothetical protein [Nitrososphaerales archaeon]